MNDRLAFEQTQLSNGIRSYFKPLDVEYTTIYLQVPVGSAHNTGSILPGTFHFLEHICVERSKRHPGLNEFKRVAGLKGGWSNATTWDFRTTYQVSVPTQYLEEVIPGLVSAVTEPLITEEDVALQRGVIDNERRRRRWYPGNSELRHYLKTQWKGDEQYPIEQLFGGTSDLAKISPTVLADAHRHYFDSRLVAMGYGSGKIDSLQKLLAEIPTSRHDLPVSYAPTRWVRKEYHEQAFQDISRLELHYGGIYPRPDLLIVQQLEFIFEYLTNSVHGSLFQWLREELGWVYSITFYSQTSSQTYDWTLMFPLTTPEQVVAVREELWDRIRAALSDDVAINREVDRIIGETAYWYHQPDSIMKVGLNQLDTFGRTITTREYIQMTETCRDAKQLQMLFGQYFTEKHVGSMCATPKS